MRTIDIITKQEHYIIEYGPGVITRVMQRHPSSELSAPSHVLCDWDPKTDHLAVTVGSRS